MTVEHLRIGDGKSYEPAVVPLIVVYGEPVVVPNGRLGAFTMLPPYRRPRMKTGDKRATGEAAGILPGILIIAVVGFLLTCSAAIRIVHTAAIYSSRVDVVFIAPQSKVNPNGLRITPSSLIAAAGVVAKKVDGTGDTTRVSSEDVTLAGEGIKHGYSVTLPNSGGQWANNFTQAVLDVQAVGGSPDEVTATMRNVVQRIQTYLDALQHAQHVAPVNLIRLQVSPPIMPMYEQHGSRARALAATLVVGLGITAAAAGAYRRITLRRRSLSGSRPVTRPAV